MAKMTKKQKAAAARRRNRARGVNVINAAEAYVQTGIWTEKLFRANPFEFFTGITEGVYKPGRDGGERITIPELLKGFQGGTYASTPMRAINRNLTGRHVPEIMQVASGLAMPAVKTALVGAGFKFGKRATSKPRAALNRLLRDFKLDGFIKF